MLFILRSAFWLGLVYLAMARDSGALANFAAGFHPRAGAQVDLVRQLDRFCAAEPSACLAAARKAASIAIGNGGDRQAADAKDTQKSTQSLLKG